MNVTQYIHFDLSAFICNCYERRRFTFIKLVYAKKTSILVEHVA